MSVSSGSNLDLTFVENDKDIEIYNQRILYILEKTINRAKLVNVVTTMANEPDSPLQNIIDTETKNKILIIKKRYENKLTGCDQNLRNEAETVEEEAWKADTVSKQADHDLAQILLSLEDSANINILLQAIKLSPHVELFIKCLKELKESIEEYQNENVAQEKTREKYLRRCQMRNEQYKKEIARLEKELIDKKCDLNASIIGKNLLVNRHQTRIERIEKVTLEAIHLRIEESKTALSSDQEASTRIQAALTSELEERTMQYNNLLQENLAAEKQLRTQRTKVENQLAAWMQKLDQDLSEKQAEEEQLQAEFENEKKKYEEIQKKLDEQEEEYDELMQEKAAYEQELLEQKLFIFILNRSARRIQNAFRAYKLRKLTKKSKKGKKGKGKKK